MLTVKEGGGGAGLALIAAWALAGVAVPVAAHAGEAVVVEVGPGRAARVARHAAQQRVGVQHEAPLALGALVRLWAGAADARLVALCTGRREGTSTAFVMEALTATPRCCQFVTISTRVQWNHAAVFTGGEKLVHLKYAGLRINQSTTTHVFPFARVLLHPGPNWITPSDNHPNLDVFFFLANSQHKYYLM